MKPIVEKVLKSGIVDKGMVELLERWGNLPEGSVDLISNETLKGATKLQLMKFAEELGEEVATQHLLKETNLDLERLRWPVEISIIDQNKKQIVYKIHAVIDRMGRYFFRFQEVNESWFVPGYVLVRDVPELKPANDGEVGIVKLRREVILEKTVLYVGEQAVCLQVTTTPA